MSCTNNGTTARSPRNSRLIPAAGIFCLVAALVAVVNGWPNGDVKTVIATVGLGYVAADVFNEIYAGAGKLYIAVALKIGVGLVAVFGLYAT